MNSVDHKNIIIFVCEHGAAKSIVAAAHFNQLADQRGMNWTAIARGTNPDPALSESAMQGLSKDGLAPTEAAPQELTFEEAISARRMISFCELPDEFRETATNEQWEGIPAVSENYDKARDAIVEGIENLLNRIT